MNRRLLLLPLFLLTACGGAASDAPAPSATTRPAQAGMCVACHGATGISSLPGTPHLAGQDESYLREALLKYRSGERPNAPMKAVVGSLSDDDLVALARYYARLPRDGRGEAGQ